MTAARTGQRRLQKWPFAFDEMRSALAFGLPDYDGQVYCDEQHLLMLIVCGHSYKRRIRDYLVEHYGVGLVYSGTSLLGFQAASVSVDLSTLPDQLALDTVVRRWIGKIYILTRAVTERDFGPRILRWPALTGKTLKLECIPDGIKARLIRELPLDVELDPHDAKCSHVLQVVELPPEEEKGKHWAWQSEGSRVYLVGLMERAQMFTLRPCVAAAKTEQAVCRAEFKIREMLTRLRLSGAGVSAGTGAEAGAAVGLRVAGAHGCSSSVSASAAAIDIGASPGGWTKHCADLGYSVAAIDPGDMDAAVLACPGVTHIRARAESAECATALRALAPPGGFGLVVCDMNAHPEACARTVLAVAQQGLLADGASIVLTLKLVNKGGGGQAERMFAMAAAVLEPHCEAMACWWLFANSKHERTLTARVRNKRSCE